MSERLEIETMSAASIMPDESGIDEDVSLVELVRAGDRIAFDRLVLKYQSKIVNLCVRMLGNHDDGEDAAQDTFVKVYNSIGQFKGNSRFSTWIYTIAVNTCRNSGRSWWSNLWKKAVKIDKSSMSEDGEEYSHELRDTRMIPSKDLDRKLQAAALTSAIKKLPVIHRELVVLRDFHELSYEEIAIIAGVNEGTVKSRLARARAALQEQLKGVLDE